MTAQSLRAKFKETVSEAILDAAEQLASEVGIKDAGLSQIAQRAGVAVGTIYNHFTDRNELFAALFRRRREELQTALDAALKAVAKEPFRVQLETFLRHVFTMFDARRAFLRMALDADAMKYKTDPNERPLQAMEHLRVRAERILKVGIKEKKVRPESLELGAFFLVAVIRTVLVARVDTDLPMAKDTGRVMTMFLEGVGAPGSHRRMHGVAKR